MLLQILIFGSTHCAKLKCYYHQIEVKKQNYNRSSVDKNLIDQKVEKAFKMKIDIPKLNIMGDFPPFEELSKIVDILLKRGYHKLENHYLPCPDIDFSKAKSKAYSLLEKNKGYFPRDVRWDQFCGEQAKIYIRKFFTLLEAAYKDVVECCFPTFKEEFEFYKSLPNEYFFYIQEPCFHEVCRYGYRASHCGKVKVNFKDHRSAEEAFEDVDFLKYLTFDNIIHVDKPLKTVDKINTREVDKYCVIRNWLYKLLERDVKKIIRENTEEDILFPDVLYLRSKNY